MMDFQSWHRLTEALTYYASQGYIETPVPWTVDRATAMITCPTEDRLYPLGDAGEILVGSAEQSFMAEQASGRLRKGRFVAITPCFRNEGACLDDLHQSYFMKVELYSTLDKENEAVWLAQEAIAFMKKQAGDLCEHLEIVKTLEGYDIEMAGIEVGSYSTRNYDGLSWTCGTGVAEPRFAKALLAASRIGDHA